MTIIGRTLSVAFTVALTVPRCTWAAAGDIDAIVRTLTGRRTVAAAVLLQPSGKLVVAGSAGPEGTEQDFVLVRYNADLSVDHTFGSGGITVTAITPSDDFATALVAQSTGTLVLAGTTMGATQQAFALARYSADGNLDPSFGTGGIVTSSPNVLSQLHGVTVQPDDKLVAVGCASEDTLCNRAVVLRYNPDGTPDLAFGQNGTVQLSFSTAVHSRSYLSAVLVQPDGKIVAAGTVQKATNAFVVVRLNPDGALDDTFGKGGLSVSAFDGYVTAVLRQPDGRVLVAGASDNINSVLVLARYQPDGSLDLGFAGDGMVQAALDVYNSDARLVLQPNGRIVLAGTSGASWGLVRYNPDGSLDGTFGVGGRVRASVTSGNLGDIKLLPDGKLVAVGSDGSRFVVVRYQGDTAAAPTPTPTPTSGAGNGQTNGSSGNSGTGSGGCAITPAPRGSLLPALVFPLFILQRRRRLDRASCWSASLIVVLLLVSSAARPNMAQAVTFTQVTIGAQCPGGRNPEVDTKAMSADGSRMVYETGCDPVAHGPGSRGVFLFDSASGVTTRIAATSDCGAAPPLISSDGRRVAFASRCDFTGNNPAGAWQIFVFDVATSSFTQVTPNDSACDTGAPFNPIRLSADGMRLVFQTSCDFPTGHVSSLPDAIYFFDATRHVLTKMTPTDNCGSFDPAISLDGMRISFRSTCDLGHGRQGGQIYLAALDRRDLLGAGCDLNGAVTVDTLVAAVDVALGTASPSRCDAADLNHDGTITIDEILSGVSSVLEGSSLN